MAELLLLLLLLAAGGRSGLVVDGSRVAEDAPAAARGAGKVGVEAPQLSRKKENYTDISKLKEDYSVYAK